MVDVLLVKNLKSQSSSIAQSLLTIVEREVICSISSSAYFCLTSATFKKILLRREIANVPEHPNDRFLGHLPSSSIRQSLGGQCGCTSAALCLMRHACPRRCVGNTCLKYVLLVCEEVSDVLFIGFEIIGGSQHYA